MLLSKDILTSLILIGSVRGTALPNPHTSLQRRASQSCHATDHYFRVSYSILIGFPYYGVGGCDNTYNAIYDSVAISNWQFVEADDRNIQLWLNAYTGYGSSINSALKSCYRSVNSFNCGIGLCEDLRTG